MPALRPIPMQKIGVLGLKADREPILSVLHDLGAVQVETVSRSSLEILAPEHASDLGREVGDALLRFRSLKAALPPRPAPGRRAFRDLAEVLATARAVPIDAEVGELKRTEDRLLTTAQGLRDEAGLLERFGFYGDRLEFLNARSILAFFGEASADAYRELAGAVPGLSEADLLSQAEGETVRFIVAVPREQAEKVSRLAQQKGVKLYPVPRRSATPAEVVPVLRAELADVERRLAELSGRLDALATEWYPTVAALEEALSIESRKLEIHTRLGAGRTTFALEGWVPTRDRPGIEAALEEVAAGRVHVYDVPTSEEPPTLMANPRGVRWFEFFIRFYSLPLSSEWDPTWIFAIVFPLFFGLMIGDIGYALVILLVSLWMIAGFPGRRGIPEAVKGIPKLIMPPNAMRSLAYTLVPGCLIGVGFGVVFNEFFGYHLLPVTLLDPIDPTGTGLRHLLLLCGYIGLLMVCLGFALGALNAYFHGHRREAAGKAAGIFFALGISYIGLTLLRSGTVNAVLPTGSALGANLLLGPAYVSLVGGMVVLAVGLGQEGGMAILETVSHVLSYTRVVGILLASVVLALLIDTFATWALGHGAGGVVAAVFILLLFQGFNLILAVFEPGIQGARLIFVEHFSKFYHGNGREFRPFGTRREHTASPVEARLGSIAAVGRLRP